MTAKRNTPEGDRLDVLITLVEAWERKTYLLDFPDPVRHGCELCPGVGLTHNDDPRRLDPRPGRFNPEQARGLAE